MPVYNYVCDECGAQFDQYLPFQDAGKKVSCPKGHAHTRKIISAPSVVFKGSGFYVTDHRNKNTSDKGS
jgi:putative FmdB family regulatory protein